MPSGSHRGGGGSHGGSHGGGSHFGGGHRGGHSSYRVRRPMFIYWGRTRYVVPVRTSGFISVLVIVLFFSLFGIFTSAMLKYNANSYINTIKKDYIYYQDMINYAQIHKDEGYVIEGKVESKFYKDYAKRWYITYSFETDYGKVEGYTFSVYTDEEVLKFRRGDVILLAVDGIPLDLDTDSIPLDYGDMPLEKDGEYIVFNNQVKGTTIALNVCISIAVGIVVVCFLLAFLSKVKVQQHSNGSANNSSNEQSIGSGERTYCMYCGAEMLKGEKRCKVCGGEQ